MKNYIQALKNISYSDWIKLRTAIDRTFEGSISEFKREIKLADTKKVELIIQSQFGQTSESEI